jgi:hypothetical protein
VSREVIVVKCVACDAEVSEAEHREVQTAIDWLEANDPRRAEWIIFWGDSMSCCRHDPEHYVPWGEFMVPVWCKECYEDYRDQNPSWPL